MVHMVFVCITSSLIMCYIGEAKEKEEKGGSEENSRCLSKEVLGSLLHIPRP